MLFPHIHLIYICTAGGDLPQNAWPSYANPRCKCELVCRRTTQREPKRKSAELPLHKNQYIFVCGMKKSRCHLRLLHFSPEGMPMVKPRKSNC